MKTLDPIITDEGVNWNYNMGYTFEVKQDGVISQLGGKWANGVDHTVRLFDYDTENQLASVSVTGSMEWNYGDITPINVTAGERYVVAVRFNNKNSGVYSILGAPVESTGIEIINCVYRSRSNRMPSTVMNNYMLGLADIRFEPCSYAGKIFSNNDFIEFGDSTGVSVAENIGSVQWQISTDGVNYTDLIGFTGQTLNTGPIYQTTYYRTYVSSGGCAPDTAMAFPVRVFDPLHPLQSTDPVIIGENIDWDYNFGYRFSPQINGNVTELGGRWKTGIEHTVRLYEYPSGTLLASANVVGSKEWAYSSITPVVLTAGSQYVVAVRVDGQSSSIYANTYNTPVTSGEVIIEASIYSGSTNAMPTTVTNTSMNGQPDIKFEPCVFAGTIKTTPDIICLGQEAALEVNGSLGTLQWQESTDNISFNNISGATNTVFDIVGLTQTSYYRIIASSVCGMDTSAVDSIVVLGAGTASGLWLGLINNDWNEPCNWGGGSVPVSGDSVVILSSSIPPVNNPEITLDFLVLTNSLGFSLSNNITITKEIHLNSGDITLNNYNILLEPNASVLGGYSTSYIVDNGAGKLVQAYNSSGSVKTFHIGDNNFYTPIDLTFNSGSFATGANVEVDLYNTEHPVIGSPADLLNRYVELTESGITSANYDLQLTYKESDIVGTEVNLVARFFNGDFWLDQGTINTITNTINYNGQTNFGSFTASSGTPFISLGNGSWNSAGTWFGGVIPSLETHSVIISEGDTVSVTADVVVESLNLQINSALTFGKDKVVEIKKDFNANGSVTGRGQFSFTGSELQRLNTTNFIFDHVNINNSNGVILETGAFGVRGAITIPSGTLFTNNALTLLSDEVYTGSIGDLTNGDVVGNVKVERFMNTYSTKWRFLSSPIANVTFEQLNDDVLTSGFPGSDYPSMNFKSIYRYNETTPNDIGLGYETVSGISSTMVLGKGYWVWAQSASGSTSPVMVDFEGEINKGDINLPLTYTPSSSLENDGWNLVGNPYPSAVDWDSPEWTKSDIEEAVYVYNPELKQYSSYISGPTPGTGAGINGGNRYISSSQSFWVHAIGSSPTLIATEKVKADSSAVFIKTDGSIKNETLGISLKGAYGADEMVVRFMAGATSLFDKDKDAAKFFSGAKEVPNIYSLDSTGKFYSINSLPIAAGLETEVYFKTVTNYAGEFELKFNGAENFAKDFCLFLKDLETDIVIDLSKESTYKFQLKAKVEEPRFVLFAQKGVDFEVKIPTCNGDDDGAIVFNEIKNMQGILSWGSEIDYQEINFDMFTQDKLEGLKSGVYSLKLLNNENNCSIDTTIEISNLEIVEASFNVIKDTIHLDKNEILELENNSQNAISYLWDFGNGKTSKEVSPAYVYPYPGTYQVKLTVNNDKGCSDELSKKVVVRDRILNEDDLLTEKKIVSYKVEENFLRLSFENFNNEKVALLVINSLGEIVLKSELNLSGSNSHLIRNNFSTGIYLIKLSTENFETVKKVNFN